MKPDLNYISKPVKNELNQFNKLFKKSLKSNIGIVDLLTRYILKQKGKKIRPLLVLLSSKVVGEVNDSTYRGATLVELLHTATLVHDDVVDGAEKRRGLPSINYVWKNKIAVLMGDYLLSRGLLLSVDGDDFDFLKVTSKTVKRMAEGELLQIKKTQQLNIDEETYFRIISDKTASLLSTCCEIGALSTTDNTEKIIAMRNYGEFLGIAFQIRDDILDYVGTSKLVGKPLGADIRDKKITLPLIYSLANATDSKKKEILKFLRNKLNKDNVNYIIEFVKNTGGIEYAEKIGNEYVKKAKAALEVFNDSDSKNSLISLINFVILRNK